MDGGEVGRKQATNLNLNLSWVENTKTRTCSHLRRVPQRDKIPVRQNNMPPCVYLWRWSGTGEFLLFTH